QQFLRVLAQFEIGIVLGEETEHADGLGASAVPRRHRSGGDKFLKRIAPGGRGEMIGPDLEDPVLRTARVLGYAGSSGRSYDARGDQPTSKEEIASSHRFTLATPAHHVDHPPPTRSRIALPSSFSALLNSKPLAVFL